MNGLVGSTLTDRSAPPAPARKAPTRVSPRAVAFVALTVAYVLLTIGVLVPSPVLDLDTYLLQLRLWHNHPDWWPWIHTYVIFGQRGPATLAFLPFFIWVAWRRRSAEPLIMLGAALILLNLSVGVVKYGIGRVGPRHTDAVHLIFAGGNIYPSGHVSNTVVLYGLVAWITPKFRKTVIAAAVFLSVTVGLGTVYLRTHWFSDVVGGWIAGALVLLALPTIMPTSERITYRVVDWVRARRARRRAEGQGTSAPRPARHPQGKATPVSSVARSQSFAATAVSMDAREEPTRRGKPRISPIPSGP
jgi:membrane-associated phospholipid phosphatase